MHLHCNTQLLAEQVNDKQHTDVARRCFKDVKCETFQATAALCKMKDTVYCIDTVSVNEGKKGSPSKSSATRK